MRMCFCFVLFVVGIYFYIASCVSKLSITADKEALLYLHSHGSFKLTDTEQHCEFKKYRCTF
jgi:hypothetical protein